MSLSSTFENWFAPSAATASWTLDRLRGIDPVLGFAIVMVVAVVLGEILRRRFRLPRLCGHMLTGALASPLALRLLERTDLDPVKPLIDLAIGVLVFELGSRIRPRWLIDNPWLALTCVLEGVLSGLAVYVGLLAFDAPSISAALAGAVAMSTSPVIVLALVHQMRPRGQVTERLLMMSAINSVLAVVALKAWGVLAASGGVGVEPVGLEPAITSALLVVSGSFLLGVAAGWILTQLTKQVRGLTTAPVLQIALVIIAAMLAAQWRLSPLLALLVAGMVARSRMAHGLTVEPQLGTAGATLSVMLFICLGMLFTLDGFSTLWPWVLVIVVARLIGKGVAIAALTRPSGLGWRQACALTIALQPMSSLAVLLTADTFGWPSQLPGANGGVLQALLISTTLLQFIGPLLAERAVRDLAQECAPVPKTKAP